jgi:hypothetical protein
MFRYLAVLGLAAATLACGATDTSERTTSSDPVRLASAVSCPAVATACSSGCFAVGAHPVDTANRCLLPRRTFGCSPFDTIGPPAVTCSVSPDETVWISFEARTHPLGRFCSDAEWEAMRYPRCP